MFIMDDPEHREYTRWDIVLATGYEIHKSMMNGDGMPLHWDRSDRVVFDVKSYVSKSRAAIERAEEKAMESKTKNYGKVFYAVPRTRDGGPLPTLDEFNEEQRQRAAMTAGKVQIGGEFSNADWKPE